MRTTLSTLILLAAAALPLSANPFLGGTAEAPPTPPRAVISGGTGPFTELQLEFREKVSSLLGKLKDDPSGGILTAYLLVSFVYGLLHGAGPGHRKTVVFSLFLSRKAKLWEPLAAGFLSAGLHAATALAIIAFYAAAERGISSLAGADRAGIYLEGSTFLILVCFAAFLLARKLAAFIRRRGHCHGEGGGKGLYSMILLTSLIPCPGATMIMLFSLYLGEPLLGLLGVLAMSVGMGLVVSAAGYLAAAGREGLFLRLAGSERRIQLAADILELGSYLFILVFSLFMAWPFLVSLFRFAG